MYNSNILDKLKTNTGNFPLHTFILKPKSCNNELSIQKTNSSVGMTKTKMVDHFHDSEVVTIDV